MDGSVKQVQASIGITPDSLRGDMPSGSATFVFQCKAPSAVETNSGYDPYPISTPTNSPDLQAGQLELVVLPAVEAAGADPSLVTIVGTTPDQPPPVLDAPSAAEFPAAGLAVTMESAGTSTILAAPKATEKAVARALSGLQRIRTTLAEEAGVDNCDAYPVIRTLGQCSGQGPLIHAAYFDCVIQRLQSILSEWLEYERLRNNGLDGRSHLEKAALQAFTATAMMDGGLDQGAEYFPSVSRFLAERLCFVRNHLSREGFSLWVETEGAPAAESTLILDARGLYKAMQGLDIGERR